MKALSLENLAAAHKQKKRQVAFVRTPELAPEGTPEAEVQDHGVYVLEMSLEEKEAQENAMAKIRGKKDSVDNFAARFIARTICDAQGTCLCNDAHWELFKGFGANVMTRIFNAAWKLNGYDQKDLEAMVEQLKNAPSTSDASA